MKNAKKLILAIIIILSMTATMIPITASATSSVAFGAATVDTDILRLRSGPGTNHSVLARLSEGDVVVILERTNTEWFRVNFQGTEGFVSVPLLRNVRLAANFTAQGLITSSSRVNMRQRPNTNSASLGLFSEGTRMTIIGINNGWYKVRQGGNTGYIRSDLMQIISEQNTPSVTRISAPAPNPNLPLAQQLVDYALEYVGVRYVWGGASPNTGFDCSGFTSYIFRTFDMSLTRNASGQFRDNGVHIDKSELTPGDLVFASSNGGRSVTHVGIYIGDGEFVHASSARGAVMVSDLNSSYQLSVWHGAKRVMTS